VLLINLGDYCSIPFAKDFLFLCFFWLLSLIADLEFVRFLKYKKVGKDMLKKEMENEWKVN